MNDMASGVTPRSTEPRAAIISKWKRPYRFGPSHAAGIVIVVAVALEFIYYRHAIEVLHLHDAPLWDAPAPMRVFEAPSLDAEDSSPPLRVPIPSNSIQGPHREAAAPLVRAPTPPPSVTIAPSADGRIREAYRAWSQNNIAEAKRLYEEALVVAPRHRQAQLGLAAIAVRQNDPAAAQAWYQRLLTQDPYDGDAIAGLINLAHVQTTEDESLLKLLIARGVPHASVYNQLGNIFAAQGRWPEAHRSYAEGFRRDALGRKGSDAGDADLAFNLAVSLDHLGQTKAALEHYRLAERYAAAGPSAFPVEQARARIESLEASGGGA